MKKLLTILGVISLIATSAMMVSACSSSKSNNSGNDSDDGDATDLLNQLVTANQTLNDQTIQISTLAASNASLQSNLLTLIATNVRQQESIKNLIGTSDANEAQLEELYQSNDTLNSQVVSLSSQLADDQEQLLQVRTGVSWTIDAKDTTSKTLSRKYKSAATGQWRNEKWVLRSGNTYNIDRYVDGIGFNPFGTWSANNSSTRSYFNQLGFVANVVNGSTGWQAFTSASSLVRIALSDDQITKFKNQLTIVKKVITTNEKTITNLTTTNQTLTSVATSLTTASASQVTLIADINRYLSAQQTQLNALQVTNTNLESQVTSLSTQLKDVGTELGEASDSNGWIIDIDDSTNKTITRTYKNPNTGNWQTEKVIVATGGTTLNRTIDGTSYPYQNAMNANEGTAQTFFKSLGFNLVQVNSQWVFSILAV